MTMSVIFLLWLEKLKRDLGKCFQDSDALNDPNRCLKNIDNIHEFVMPREGMSV